MRVGSIGYNFPHTTDFVMDCPNGPGCWLFLHVRAPAIFEVGGKSYKVAKGSALVISPLTQCRYYGDGATYVDDWIYFNMSDEDQQRLMDMGIVFDEPVRVEAALDISTTVHKLTFEHFSDEPYHVEMEEMYFDILFIKLARAFSTEQKAMQKLPAEKDSAIASIRQSIYSDPVVFSNVKYIAERAQMSCSGLQHLYKRLFGVTVSADIINSRLLRAKSLLSTTSLTVDRIAESCGYSCTYSFLRQFKERIGCTPTEFRKRALPDEELLGRKAEQ